VKEDTVTQADPSAAVQQQRTANITIDGQHYAVHERYLTGAQILAVAGLSSADQLFREVPGPGDDEPIAPDKVVELRDGEKFYAVPVGNFG
jgi:hypothetical protein